MRIIPVIDLKDGQVVHAVRGAREHYQPIHLNSRLCASSDADDVIESFLRLYPFDCFYCADLDAICGHGNHTSVIQKLLKKHPDIEFWLDNGTQLAQIQTAQANLKHVIGTESQLAEPSRVEQDYVLSLDFKQDAMGKRAWFERSEFWPQQIIVMTLGRVGSQGGPDFEKLTELSSLHPEKNWIAAGGVRGPDDLKQLANLRISGILIATALHSGAISTNEIAKLHAKKYPGEPGYR